MAQGMLPLVPPYGSVIQGFAPVSPGHPPQYYLMYDTEKGELIYQWLREMLVVYEETQKRQLPVVKTEVPLPEKKNHDWGPNKYCRKCGEKQGEAPSNCEIDWYKP
jgi:hypothetical protein